MKHKDLSHLDRNLDALVQDLAGRCSQVFEHACGAAARSADISFGKDSVATIPRSEPFSNHVSFIRERIITEKHEVRVFLSHKCQSFELSLRMVTLCNTLQAISLQLRSIGPCVSLSRYSKLVFLINEYANSLFGTTALRR